MKKILSAVILHALLLPATNGQSKLFDQDVQLKTCNISIEANPFVATTFIEMEFYNPRDTEVEGYQNLILNKGQVVTAFQLDLNGKYRDGSIEEKWKANRAYSMIVGKRVDPAILQMGYDHSYSLRIYPIPAHGSRKVTMTIDQLMLEDSMKLNYELPLNFSSVTENFRLSVNVTNPGTIPVSNKGFLQNTSFEIKDNHASLGKELKDIKLNQSISFSIPLAVSMPQLCISKEGGVAKFVMRFSPQVPVYYPIKPTSISVFWDISASATTRNIKKEIDFLEQYIISNQIITTTISLFNQQVQHQIIWDSRTNKFDVLRRYLSGYRYAGATTFSNLDFAGTKADAILIFSDGFNSFGKPIPGPATVPVNCIVSTVLYDQNQLQQIIAGTGGAIIRLYQTAIPDALTGTGQAQNFLVKYNSAEQTVTINEKFPMKIVNNILLSGTFKNNDHLQLIFGNSSAVNKTENIYLQENDLCGKEIYKKVQMLKSYDSMIHNSNWQDMIIFGLKEKVVTPQTSFLVLERIEDYIKYNIAPPKELEQECAERNYVYKSEYKIRALKTFSEQEALQKLVTDYNRYINWWDTEATLIDLNKPIALATTETGTTGSGNRSSVPGNPPGEMKSSNTNTIKEVIVTSAFQTKRTLRSQSSNVQTVSAEQLNIIRTTDVNNALAGKIAGLQVRSQSGVKLGSVSSVRLRGENGLTAGSGPIYVVDGAIIPNSSFINTDDIENITVLQGPAACALFGPEGANGAIVITNKKASRHYFYNYSSWKDYKLKDVEEVEYMSDIKGFATEDLWEGYTDIEKRYKGKAGFYFDMADYFFERKLKEKAVEILFEGIESCRGNVIGLKAAAYMFESWKDFREAIKIYQDMIVLNPTDLVMKRDLALAYFQNGDHQLAVNTYYKLICSPDKDYYDEAGIRIMAMNEMNAVISLHKDSLDLSSINLNLVKPLPLDLKITIESNYSYVNYPRIINPQGNECSQYSPDLKNGGRFTGSTLNRYYYDQNDYSLKNATKGTYRIKVNSYTSHYYYNYYYNYQNDIPFYLRLVVFKNFQKVNQTMEVQYIVMDNQYGSVEVAELKW